MKSLMLFLQEVLSETGTWCHISTSMDVKYIRARVEDEGLSFLTITLPNYGKAFEKALDQGYVDRNLFAGFQLKGELPRFLGGFLDLVFNRVSGRLLDEPSIVAIRAIRQISLMFGKVAVECTSARTDNAILKYVQCEQEVKQWDKLWSDSDKESFSRISTLLWYNIFQNVQQDIISGDIVPKHGPGSTADRLFGNKKYDQRLWTTRLEAIFPCGEFVFHNWSAYLYAADSVTFLEPGSEIPVKVITVPKTLKTPRIIAVEPAHMQYVQQGILESFVKHLKADDRAFNLIGFEHQEPNQVLALEGSLHGDLATLDLSEASDRVSNQHVRTLLMRHPLLAEGVDSCRSRKADVPGHGIIRLAKFASMGSALCFPFEAAVFATAIFVGIEKELGRPIRMSDINSLSGQVRVYGDDIIVPVRYVQTVVSSLEALGLKVNSSKSFWTGKFRESCGKEYYDGFDVSLVRVRQLFPTQRLHTQQLVSTVSLRNQLYAVGFRTSVDFLDSLIEELIPFPRVSPESAALGKHNLDGFDTEKMCPDMQRPMVKAAVVSTKLPSSLLDGDGALMKFFLKRGDLPVTDGRHLQYAGRPVSLDIKRRWVYSD